MRNRKDPRSWLYKIIQILKRKYFAKKKTLNKGSRRRMYQREDSYYQWPIGNYIIVVIQRRLVSPEKKNSFRFCDSWKSMRSFHFLLRSFLKPRRCLTKSRLLHYAGVAIPPASLLSKIRAKPVPPISFHFPSYPLYFHFCFYLQQLVCTQLFLISSTLHCLRSFLFVVVPL